MSIRIAFAFIVATTIAVIALPTISCVAGILEGYAGGCTKIFSLSLPIIALFAFPTMLVIGVPLFLLFRRKYWLALWQVIVGSCVTGLVGGIVFWLQDPGLSLSGMLLFCGGLGALAGIPFWYFGVRAYES